MRLALLLVLIAAAIGSAGFTAGRALALPTAVPAADPLAGLRAVPVGEPVAMTGDSQIALALGGRVERPSEVVGSAGAAELAELPVALPERARFQAHLLVADGRDVRRHRIDGAVQIAGHGLHLARLWIDHQALPADTVCSWSPGSGLRYLGGGELAEPETRRLLTTVCRRLAAWRADLGRDDWLPLARGEGVTAFVPAAAIRVFERRADRYVRPASGFEEILLAEDRLTRLTVDRGGEHLVIHRLVLIPPPTAPAEEPH